ncbi:hypothetical protein [Tabrizicola sp.]|uniref:hypothetical protein n=1 Tax=Tabrizicola sp. TaxID=2005166 RepID=UPI003D2E5033
MYHSHQDDFVFEFERSINKEEIIHYNIKSMAASCKAMDSLVYQLFIICEIDSLINVINTKKRQSAEERLKRNLRSLLWHLYKAQRKSMDTYVRISLCNSAFSGRDDRNPFGISRELRDIIHLLDTHGFIEKHIGFLSIERGVSKYTRVRTTLKLLPSLQELPKDIGEEPVAAPALAFRRIVKTKMKKWSDEEKRYINWTHVKKEPVSKPYECMELDRAERIVSTFNSEVANYWFSMEGHMGSVVRLTDPEKEREYVVDMNDRSMTAIFHVQEKAGVEPTKDAKRRYEISYGRMHGGFWQSTPSKFRKRIQIDGMPTVELDYSGQVLNMAASDSKVQLVGDPYAVDLGISFLDDETQRDLIKSCIVIMINTDSKRSAVYAVKQKVEDEGWWTTSAMNLHMGFIYGFFDRIFAHHPFLTKYAFKGRGKRFFLRDSEVARQVIDVFLGQGKIVLPIHDGFIAKEEDADLLRQTMETAWYDNFGTTIGIK